MIYMPGEKVKITVKEGQDEIRFRRGTIVANHHYVYVVQHKGYREAYKKSDIKLGIVIFELTR